MPEAKSREKRSPRIRCRI